MTGKNTGSMPGSEIADITYAGKPVASVTTRELGEPMSPHSSSMSQPTKTMISAGSVWSK